MNSLKRLMISSLSFSLISCQTPLPDIELCGKLSLGAHCNKTLSDKPRTMTESEWDTIGRVSMSFEDFGELKKFMLSVCKRSEKCNLEDEKKIEVFYGEFE